MQHHLSLLSDNRPAGSVTGTVAVAVSGGTDSLASLLKLKRAGCSVIALHAFFLPPNDRRRRVAEALEAICRPLGIPLFVEDLSQLFDGAVIAPFVAAYASGRTPNPCAHCNRRMKFGALFEAARQHGADWLATGHYAGLTWDTNGRPALMRGLDATRDQSYFLSLVPLEALSRVIFPLAGQHKTEVRQWLAAHGYRPPLPHESRDICFVEDGDYRRFLLGRGLRLPGEGPIVLADGNEIGRHQGLWRYTIGQRRGLGVPYEAPLYVLDKDVSRNALIVGKRPALGVSGCRVRFLNALVPPASWPAELFIQTCYRMRPRPVTVAWRDEMLDIRFAEPLARPAAGQVAVLYDRSGRVLAGGIIIEEQS